MSTRLTLHGNDVTRESLPEIPEETGDHVASQEARFSPPPEVKPAHAQNIGEHRFFFLLVKVAKVFSVQTTLHATCVLLGIRLAHISKLP